MGATEQFEEQKFGKREQEARGGEFGRAIFLKPQKFRRPVARMRKAAGARMSIGNARDFRSAARVEQMQNRKRRPPVFADTEEAVPESAPSDGRDLEPGRVDLAMEIVEAIDG
jgi:hypothetical protein